MTDNKICILNTEFTNVNLQKAVDILEQEIRAKRKFSYSAVKDVSLAVRSLEDEFLSQFYKKCDYIFVDGRGLVYASRLLRKPLIEMVGGPAILSELLRRGEIRGYSFYILGAREPVLKKAVSKLQEQYPHINIVGYRNGHFNLDESLTVVEEINDKNPDVLIIGITTPKREQFIEKHRGEFKNMLCLPVGGALDVIAGLTRYAPKWISIMGLEWLYRALQEPSRLLTRYAKTHVKFIIYITKEFIRGQATQQ